VVEENPVWQDIVCKPQERMMRNLESREFLAPMDDFDYCIAA